MQTRERETWTWDDDYAHVQQKSFARLTDEALDELCNIGSIVDMGAGNGYWTRELADRGVDIVAVEPNRMANPVFPRREADHWCITDYPNRALLMIWPTRQAAWPQQCVQKYKGNTVAYVQHALNSINVIANVAYYGEKDSDRLKAAEIITERVLGKVTQRIEVHDADPWQTILDDIIDDAVVDRPAANAQ
jgi:hypothetical protein